jgi:hypothetical protein
MEETIKIIKEKWNLPNNYLNFLNKFNPRGKDVEGEKFVNLLHVYGFSELIKNQDGYSYNPITKKTIEDWPKDYVVIADDGADPYVLDLSKSDGIDAPVLFALHGEGEWNFTPFASSFKEFLIQAGVER